MNTDNSKLLNVLEFVDDLLGESKSPTTDARYQRIVFHVLSNIEYKLETEYQKREDFQFSKSGRRRSNERIQKLEKDIQKCHSLLR